jgi:hypothetical protein
MEQDKQRTVTGAVICLGISLIWQFAGGGMPCIVVLWRASAERQRATSNSPLYRETDPGFTTGGVNLICHFHQIWHPRDFHFC